MAKPRNPVRSEKFTITTTPRVRLYLEKLVAMGLYGKNAPEAADRLLSRGIEALIRDGTLQPVGTKANGRMTRAKRRKRS
jgi:hypothetical protein